MTGSIPLRVNDRLIGTFDEYSGEVKIYASNLKNALRIEKKAVVDKVTVVRDKSDRVICTYDIKDDILIIHGARQVKGGPED